MEKPQRCGVCGSGLWDQERRRAVGAGRPGIKKDREAGGGKGGSSKRGGAAGPKASAGQGQVGAGGSGIREGGEPEEGSGVGVDAGVGRVGSGAAYIFKEALNEQRESRGKKPLGKWTRAQQAVNAGADEGTGRGSASVDHAAGGRVVPGTEQAGRRGNEEAPEGRMWVGAASVTKDAPPIKRMRPMDPLKEAAKKAKAERGDIEEHPDWGVS